jgi:hypothetical protein
MKEYNPFNPNSVVATNLFAGRKDYILTILGKLNQVKKGMPSSFFLFGERGIGKTALAKLIKYVSEIKDPVLENLNFLTSYYSAEKGQPISSILQASLNELTDNMPRSMVEDLGHRLGNIFKNGKFSIGAFSVGLELDLKDEAKETLVLKDLIVSILSNIISAIRKENAKDGILIIIDEMDNVSDIMRCAQLFRGVNTTLDVKGMGHVSFLLIGYERTVENFYKGDKSARRHFDTIQLDTMPAEEAKEVLEMGFKEANLLWDDLALTENIIVTGGYPHSIQLIGHHLIEVDADRNITEDDWDKAISKAAYDLARKEFADLYNFQGKPSLKELILDILAVKGSLIRQELRQYAQGKNIYQYIPELIKRGSIKENKKTGAIRLHSRLFQTAILLHIIPRIRHEGYLDELFKEEQS